jgi:1,4-alpha-glucan branching enzyme
VWEDLKNFFAGMAALRASQPALTRNNLEALVVDNERRMIVFKRWNEEGNQVVVGLNFAPVTQHIEVTFPRAGRWHEWVYDSGTDFGDAAQQSVELPASGGKVWIAA